MKWKCSGCFEMVDAKKIFVLNTSEHVALCFQCVAKVRKDSGVEIGPRVLTDEEIEATTDQVMDDNQELYTRLSDSDDCGDGVEIGPRKKVT